MMTIKILLIISTVAFAQSDVTSPGQAGESARVPLNKCQEQFTANNCSQYKNDPDIKPLLKKCDGNDESATTFDLAKVCGEQAAGVWAEIISAVQQAPQAIVSGVANNIKKKNKPTIRLQKWKNKCRRSEKCLRRLVLASTKKELSEKQIKKGISYIKKAWMPNAAFNEYYNRAANRDGLGMNKDPWFNKQMQIIYPKQKKGEAIDVYGQAKALLNQQYAKYNHCLNDEGRKAMECYAFFSIADPTLAVGLAAKSGKLAKLLKAMSSKGKKVVAAAARKIIGNKVRAGSLSPKVFDSLQAKNLPEVTLQKLKKAMNSLDKDELAYLNQNPNLVLSRVKACGRK